MLTEKQIDDQQEFERKQISGGLEKLRSNTSNLEDKTYASATVYGSACINSILPDLIAYIEKEKIKRLEHGAHMGAIVHKHLMPVANDLLALLACKVAFDHVFATRENKWGCTAISLAMGEAIEGECQMRHYETEAPALLATLKKNYWHQSKGTESKLVCIQTLMNKQDLKPWESWNKDTKIKIGTFLLNCLMEATVPVNEEEGWFKRIHIRKGRKTISIIAPTELLIKHHDEIMRMAELFSPLAKPMLIPPRNWYPLQDGGYYLNDLTKCHDLVRRSKGRLIQRKTPYEFINKIQQVSYKLNPFIVEVAEELEERGISVGKFRPVIQHEIPPKPFDIADNEVARKEWRKSAAIARNKQAAEVRKSCRTRMTMEVVREFKDKVYYIPWSFDYRGRCYPIPNLLTPQCTDFGKSLILFNEGAKITEKGMEACGSCYCIIQMIRRFQYQHFLQEF